ncbi:hypothetical protein GF325_17125 [Candidatus Bathyarchaeota archaeon]|nr:hypothetical protein [Candidatus Bathyarchaeota archaeon]
MARENKPRIVIAGAGHGGLIAGRILARAGFPVEIIEKSNRGNLGWDWEDNFNLTAFKATGSPLPPASQYYDTPRYTFVSPDLSTRITASHPPERREICMERKTLIEKLILEAESAGVALAFNTLVEGPIIEKGAVTGVDTNAGPVHGDIIIDSAGIDSPVRLGLPNDYRVVKEMGRGHVFHTYRAYHERTLKDPVKESTFNVHLRFNGMLGITWYRPVPGCIDILAGQIHPFPKNGLEGIVNAMNDVYNDIGKEVLRGGGITRIPVRRPLPLFVGNGYAAVGDAACMTVPITGSGIEISMRAGALLARTIIKQSVNDDPRKVESLWKYQVQFTKEMGSILHGIDYLKSYILSLSLEKINFVFRKRLITAGELSSFMVGSGIQMGAWALIQKLIKGFSKLGFLLDLKRAVDTVSRVQKLAASIPRTHDGIEISKWANAIQEHFDPLEQSMQ